MVGRAADVATWKSLLPSLAAPSWLLPPSCCRCTWLHPVTDDMFRRKSKIPPGSLPEVCQLFNSVGRVRHGRSRREGGEDRSSKGRTGRDSSPRRPNSIVGAAKLWKAFRPRSALAAAGGGHLLARWRRQTSKGSGCCRISARKPIPHLGTSTNRPRADCVPPSRSSR